MGCSAGMISIGLAERLLKQEPGKYALVLSTENISLSWYDVPWSEAHIQPCTLTIINDDLVNCYLQLGRGSCFLSEQN